MENVMSTIYINVFTVVRMNGQNVVLVEELEEIRSKKKGPYRQTNGPLTFKARRVKQIRTRHHIKMVKVEWSSRGSWTVETSKKPGQKRVVVLQHETNLDFSSTRETRGEFRRRGLIEERYYG